MRKLKRKVLPAKKSMSQKGRLSDPLICSSLSLKSSRIRKAVAPRDPTPVASDEEMDGSANESGNESQEWESLYVSFLQCMLHSD